MTGEVSQISLEKQGRGHRAGRQSVEAVGEVDGVGRRDGDEGRKKKEKGWAKGNRDR